MPDPMQVSPPPLSSPALLQACSLLFLRAGRQASEKVESWDFTLHRVPGFRGFHSQKHFILAGEIAGSALFSVPLQSGRGGSHWLRKGSHVFCGLTS